MRFPRNTVFQLLLFTALACGLPIHAADRRVAEVDSPSTESSTAPVVIRQHAAANGQHYFALAIKPAHADYATVRHHVIVMDTSASQTGQILESSLTLVSQIASRLAVGSQVQVLAVDVDCTPVTDGFVKAGSTELNEAIAQLSLRTPLGATNLKSAFQHILKQPTAGPMSVVYIGDGMTVGDVILSDELRSIVSQLEDRQVSVHSLVLGPTTNKTLPAVLASLTGGTVANVAVGQETATAARTVAALSIAPKTIENIAIDGQTVPVIGEQLLVRPDRHTVLCGQGKIGRFQTLTVTPEHGEMIQWSGAECRRSTAGAELVQLVQQLESSQGLNAYVTSLQDLHELSNRFAASMKQTADAIEFLQRRGRHREARTYLQQAAKLDAGNPRLQAMLTGFGQPPAGFADELPAPAPAPADGLNPVPAPGVRQFGDDPPAPGEDNVPAPNPFGDDAAPAPNPFAVEAAAQEPGAQPGGADPELPGAVRDDPVAQVEAAVQLQTQILVQETDDAISEARRMMFDEPELAEGQLKDALETVRSSIQVSPDVRSQLEGRVVEALIAITNLKEVNALKNRQIARDEAVKAAQAATLQEEKLEEERLANMIDQVRGLLDRGRHGDRNGFEDGEAIARAALDLRPGNGTATQALVMAESLGQLEKAYNLVNLRHDRFLETLYQVELSHVPFPDEPPVQYPPADVWRSLTLARKPRYEAFDLRIEAPNEKWLRQMLDKPIPPLDFPGETPLSEILETIRAYFNTTYGIESGLSGGDGRMTIYPDYAELELEGISSLEEVLIKDIAFEGMTLRNALELIFAQTSDPAELTYIIENEVFKVTTVAKATSEDNLVTRVYPVGDLVIPPSTHNQLGGGGGGFGGGLGGQQGGGFGGQQGGGFGGGQQGGFGGGGGFQSIPPEILQQMNDARDNGISTDALNQLKKKPVLN
ncbi:MAG: hypothetical protein R3C59_31485 [Planctomycetaceae bacterium]